MRRPLTIAAALVLTAALPAVAQPPAHPWAADATFGHATFVDNAGIPHWLAGGAVRLSLSDKLTVGPELVYMNGPGSDRDLFVNGTLTYDFVRPRPRAVSPYVAAGGGFFTNSYDFPSGTYTTSEGSFTAGGGVRVWLTDRVYAGGDVRVGWEPHIRFAAVAGTRF